MDVGKAVDEDEGNAIFPGTLAHIIVGVCFYRQTRMYEFLKSSNTKALLQKGYMHPDAAVNYPTTQLPNYPNSRSRSCGVHKEYYTSL